MEQMLDFHGYDMESNEKMKQLGGGGSSLEKKEEIEKKIKG